MNTSSRWPVRFGSGRYTLVIGLAHDPSDPVGNGTMDVDFASTNQAPGTTTISKTYFGSNLAAPNEISAIYLGGNPVPEPGSLALPGIATAAFVLYRRFRMSI